MRRRVRAVRILAWALSGAFLFIVAVLAALVVTLKTEWGRNRVRAELDRRLDAVFRGDLSVGRVVDAGPSRIVAEKVVLRDAAGRPTIEAERVVLRFDPFALWDRRLWASEVRIVGPVVRARREPHGAIGLSRLVERRPAKAPWRFRARAITVENGTFVLERDGGAAATVERIDAEGALQHDAGGLTLKVGRLEGWWVERALAVSAEGGVAVEEGTIVARDLEVRAAGSWVRVPSGWAHPAEGRVEAHVEGALAPDEIVRVAGREPPALGLGEEVRFNGTIARGGWAAPWRATLHLATPSAEAQAEARFEGSTWTTLRGEARASVRGSLRGVAIESLDAHAEIEGGVAHARARFETDRGRGETEWTVHRARPSGEAPASAPDADAPRPGRATTARPSRAPLAPRGHAWLVRRGRIRLEEVRLDAIDTLGVSAPWTEGLLGVAAADLEISGATDALRIAGRIRGRDWRRGSLGAERATIVIDLRGVPRSLEGTIEVVAHGVRSQKLEIGPMRVRAHLPGGARGIDLQLDAGRPDGPLSVHAGLRVTRVGGRATLRFRRMRLHARDLVFEGRGGTIRLGPRGRVEARDVVLRSRAGTIAVEGVLAGRGPRGEAPKRLHLHAALLPIAALLPLAPSDLAARLPRSGRLGVDAHLSRQGGRLQADATIELDRVVAQKGAPPLSGQIRAKLAHRRLRAEVSLRTLDGGTRLSGRVDTVVPDEIFDAGAWRRMDRREIRAAELVLWRLDLETVAALVGLPPGTSGRVSAAIRIRPGGHRIEAAAIATGLATPRLRRLDGVANALWDDDGLDVQLSTTLAGTPFVDGSLAWAAPAGRVLEETAMLGRAPIRGRVRVRRFPLARAAEAGLLRRGVGGTAELDATLGGTVVRPTVAFAARADRAHLEGIAFDRLSAAGRLDPTQAAATVTAAQRGGGRIDVRLSVMRAGRALEGEILAKAFDLGFLAALTEDASLHQVRGRLWADLAVGGTTAAPRFRGTVRLREGVVVGLWPELPRIDDLALDARIDSEKLTVEHLRARANGGWLQTKGEATLAGPGAPTRFQFDVRSRDFPVRAGRYSLGVDVKGTLAGSRVSAEEADPARGLAPGMWVARATVDEATVSLPSGRRAELQRVGPLEDVVYVDARARRERERLRARGVTRVAGAEPRARLTLRARDVRLRGPEVDADLRADLVADLAPAATTVTGSIEALGGTLTLFDHRYEITEARAHFGGEPPAQAPIDARLVREFPTVTLYVDVGGTLAAPQVRLSSDPPIYDEAQLLGFVLGGEPGGPELTEERLAGRAVGAASHLLFGPIKHQLRRVLPIDVLRMELGEEGGFSGARLEVGTYLTDELLVSYRYHSEARLEENVNEALVEWHFFRRWLLEARYGDRGNGSADVLWRKRF